MARAALLDTKTQTLIELIGNGKRYRVPPYQRDYSWGVEQWEDLWNDIIDLVGDDDERHYMGALVVEAVNDREFKIIDGQQRIATLSILALVVVDHLLRLADAKVDPEANRERAQGLRHRYVGEKDPASLVEVSKLSLNENDDGFYQDYLVQLRTPLNPRSLTHSNRALWDCFLWFQSQIRLLAFQADGKKIAEMLNDTVARKLLFIQITVDDELNAYTVFETLNARGLELTVTDLLKNYFFSRVKVQADLVALQRRWRGLIGIVRQERFPEFLRYHLLCEIPKVRTARLFKLVRDRVKSTADVFELMDVLAARAEIFAAINNVNHEYWSERPECRRPVRELILFRAKQMTPLVMAAWDKFDKVEFSKLLKLLSVVTFRYSVIGNRNTNELEPVYHLAARAVLDGAAATARGVFERLKVIYIDDEIVEQNFARLDVETSGQRKSLARYMLCKLESDASGVDIDFETHPATIEHILPENPVQNWDEDFPEELAAKYVYRLGNLTLLESSINREVENREYSQKVREYKRSKYSLTTGLVAQFPDVWTSATVDARQRELAKRAPHIWRSDFQ
ncbi:MAG: DUF262 domain-containing protein [Ramlibacter sp.]